VSPVILSLDTTAEIGSLALLRGSELLEEAVLHAPDGYGHILFDHIGRLLARHDLTPDRIDCFAAASGPGSFTGVRVGLAAAKGLAATVSKPVAAVSNLRALSTFGSLPLRAVVLDARRGQVYGAVYSSEGVPVVPETVGAFPAWLASLPPGNFEFVAQDFTPFAPALLGTNYASVPVTVAPRALAAAIGRIALGLFLDGEASDPAAIDANYVRRSDAELFWKDSGAGAQ
jgi:tRNA threonylcarbamoyladenosine biosynthesis protein TsaB